MAHFELYEPDLQKQITDAVKNGETGDTIIVPENADMAKVQAEIDKTPEKDRKKFVLFSRREAPRVEKVEVKSPADKPFPGNPANTTQNK